MRKNTKKLILENKPDLILSVFALSSRIVVDILRDIDLFDKVPVFVVVVDLFTIHFSWAEPRADLVIVPTEKAKAQLIKYGVPVEKLRVTGLPISSRFNEETRLDRFRKEMNLKEALFTVMIMGGGEGSGDIYEIVDILSKSNLDIQVVVVAGRNKKLENKLRGLKKESNLQMKVFGFTNKIPELMSVSNILITKAGPVTLMEAFSKELPVVITGRVPDQEEGNVEYVRSKNLGYVINEKEEIIDILRRAINFRSELELMRQNIRKERKVNGADKVADLIMRESRYDRAGLGVKKP